MSKLFEVMESKKIRLCDLALITGIHYSRLCMYRKGYERPCYETAVKIAKALKCEVEDIFPGKALRGELIKKQCILCGCMFDDSNYGKSRRCHFCREEKKGL